jgi:ankyrin repeat protein
MEGTSASRPVARSELDQATFAGNYKRMEELLKQGFDVNQSSPQGQLNLWTPLHTAARRGDLRAVRLLVENGANIEMEWEELTAEDYARKNEYIEISDFLKRKRKELEKDVERGIAILFVDACAPWTLMMQYCCPALSL